MTRFARARGSKSSNEKAPEDSTPWEVMKEQLLQSKKENEESKKRQEAENQRIENYQTFLKEQKVQKKKATWCDFPETTQNQDSSYEPTKKKKKGTKKEVSFNKSTESDLSTANTADKSSAPLQSKKNKKKKLHQENNETKEILTTDNSAEVSTPSQKKKKKKKKNTQQESDVPKSISNGLPEGSIESNVGNDNKTSKKKKNKKFKQPAETNESYQPDRFKDDPPVQTGNDTGTNNQNINKKKEKKKKMVNGKPVRRKLINDNSFQLIINGKEVILVRFDGFPVMKKDAERLQELKDNMIKKGIPKSEVQRTMKLERRRAEKALARMKREVCYNCRKGGHNLSDCPDLKSKIPGVDAPDGVCFKCGSTEHKQFDCKVQRNTEFKFATCFICKEPGHIARQCPDNPKGLYPNGGSCKLCGDVTHLRKDCPTVNVQKEETSIKLPTMEYDNIEDIAVQNKTSTVELTKKPKKITF